MKGGRWVVPLLLSVVVVASAACATATVHQPSASAESAELVGLQRVGLAAFTVKERIQAGKAGLFRGLQPNAWGRQLADQQHPRVQKLVEQILRTTLVANETLVALPSYQSAPRRPEGWYAPAPWLPLRSQLEDDEALGAIAAEAGLDAVLVVATDFSVRGESDSLQQWVCNRFSVVMVDKAGRRLWAQSGGVRSTSSPMRAAAVIGATLEEDALRMGADALTRALDELDRHYAHRRDGVPLRPQMPLRRGAQVQLVGSCR